MRLKLKGFVALLLGVSCFFTITACSTTKVQDIKLVSSSSKQEEVEAKSSEPVAASSAQETVTEQSIAPDTTSVIPPETPKDGKIHIKYVGNSCFYIVFADGTKLVTDPYGSTYAPNFAPFPTLEANVMTISHMHADHIAGEAEIGGNPQILQPDPIDVPVKVGDVEITSYTSNHPADMGTNIIFVYKEGKHKIVNMGETDTIDSPEAKAAVKGADVIFAYAGQFGTVKNKDSFETLSKMNFKVMIPQHFSMDPANLFYGAPTIDTILTELPQGMKVTKADELIVTEDMAKQFVVLSPIGQKK